MPANREKNFYRGRCHGKTRRAAAFGLGFNVLTIDSPRPTVVYVRR
jgi:hypothetical protein